MNHAPTSGAVVPVVGPGEFPFAAAFFDHGHIHAQIAGLADYGGSLRYVYDPEPSRYAAELDRYPGVKAVADFREILDDPTIRCVTTAAIPSERCDIGVQVLESGKDYLTDKSPFTTLEQLERARRKVDETAMRYQCCYSERLLNEAAWHVGELIADGAPARPPWFFRKADYGGILTDIGSHQFEQFLTYAGARDAVINHARVANVGHPEHPELEDFGEAHLTTDTGVSCYCRLDWWTPAGLRTWGDGRAFVLGTKGTIEARKYLDVARDSGGNRVFLVDERGEHEIDCTGQVGFPFFGRFILDCLQRTEHSMSQAHCFKAAELSMLAQEMGERRAG
jgi:predicted dehydrogenase